VIIPRNTINACNTITSNPGTMVKTSDPFNRKSYCERPFKSAQTPYIPSEKLVTPKRLGLSFPDIKPYTGSRTRNLLFLCKQINFIENNTVNINNCNSYAVRICFEMHILPEIPKLASRSPRKWHSLFYHFTIFLISTVSIAGLFYAGLVV
jgi:hypothetical protein